jgi:hypothetical protein
LPSGGPIPGSSFLGQPRVVDRVLGHPSLDMEGFPAARGPQR